MPDAIEIYFAPHFSTFIEPIISPKFRRCFDACDTCILEWADRWRIHEPELESLFNQLSRGQISWVKSRRLGRDLNPFDRELQNAIRGENKRIILERSPVEYSFIQENDVKALAQAKRLDEAVALYKSQLGTLVQNLVKRDQVIVEMLRAFRWGKLFVFRGADHERYLRYLLDERSITAKCITYEEPLLLRRLIGKLSMGEQIDDIDIQRAIYVILNHRQEDYMELVALQKETMALTDEELGTCLV